MLEQCYLKELKFQRVITISVLQIHSIKQYMSGIAQRQQISACNQGDLGPRRRRVPSIYADGITELKKIASKFSRRVKNPEMPSEESQFVNRYEEQKNSALECVLPSSKRRLKIHIIIKKSKNVKPKSSKSAAIVQPVKTPPTQPKSHNLLDALFKLCEQHKVNEELKSKDTDLKIEQQSNSNEALEQKGHRTRKVKQDEQKYVKMYEKYMLLNQKMGQIDIQTFMI